MFVKAVRSFYEKSKIEHWNTNLEKLTVQNNSKGPVPWKRRTVSGKGSWVAFSHLAHLFCGKLPKIYLSQSPCVAGYLKVPSMLFD